MPSSPNRFDLTSPHYDFRFYTSILKQSRSISQIDLIWPTLNKFETYFAGSVQSKRRIAKGTGP